MKVFRKALTVAMLFGGSLFFSAPDLHAQGSTWMGIELWDAFSQARHRIGPFRVNSSFNITNAGYDSNIYPGLAEEPIADATISVGTDFNIYLPLSNKVLFNIIESPYYTYYLETERERGLNNILAGKFHFLLKKIYLSIGGGISNIRQRVSTEVDFRVRTKEDQAVGSIFWQAGRWAAFLAEFELTKFTYSDPPLGEPDFFERLDRQESILGLTAFAQTSSNIRLRFDTKYSSYVFQISPETRNSRSYIISGGLDFLEAAHVQGTANLGFRYFDSINPEGIDHKGLYGDISLAWNLNERWVLRGSFQKGPQFSAWSDFLYYVQTSFGSGISYQLSRRTQLGYDFSFVRNFYPTNDPGDADERSDRYLVHTGRIGFQLGRSLNLSLIANISTRRSTLEVATYDRTFIGFNLIYDF